MQELKRCPFCNYDKVEITSESLLANRGRYTEYAVMCKNCGAQGPNELTDIRAVEMWDMRRDKFPQEYEGNG